jgi:thiamine biosynthesis lipoprotein
VKQTRHIMGMPVTAEIVGETQAIASDAIELVMQHFTAIDHRFSTYKPDSEISRVNAGLPRQHWSQEMTTVLDLCERTRQATGGYFDISTPAGLDPSGLVKGWAINEAAKLLQRQGIYNFYLEAGGDIQTSGHNSAREPWRVGIRHPFNRHRIVKALQVAGQGVATSGTYIRGQHVYNPHEPDAKLNDIVSLTVIGPNIYEADRFATAAFAMGRSGIGFIQQLGGFEGYAIDAGGTATMTRGFERLAT